MRNVIKVTLIVETNKDPDEILTDLRFAEGAFAEKCEIHFAEAQLFRPSTGGIVYDNDTLVPSDNGYYIPQRNKRNDIDK